MKIDGIKRAIQAVADLRGPEGCPWDKEQTHESLRTYLLEETHEVLEALDGRVKHGDAPLREELGDLLFQVLLHAQIAEERGAFTLDDIAGDLADKLIRRHPHVFGGERLMTAGEVLGQWEVNKSKEKTKDSRLDGIPPALPALQRSLKVIEKVSQVGFQWPDLKGPLEKVREELGEFEAELEKIGAPEEIKRGLAIPEDKKRKLEGEMGDLLFCVSNLAFFLNLNPEDSLRSMLGRFEGRFRHVEKRAAEMGKKLDGMSLAEMDELWAEAKKQES